MGWTKVDGPKVNGLCWAWTYGFMDLVQGFNELIIYRNIFIVKQSI